MYRLYPSPTYDGCTYSTKDSLIPDCKGDDDLDLVTNTVNTPSTIEINILHAGSRGCNHYNTNALTIVTFNLIGIFNTILIIILKGKGQIIPNV